MTFKAFVVDTFHPREVVIVDTIGDGPDRKAVIEFADKPGMRFLYPITDIVIAEKPEDIDMDKRYWVLSIPGDEKERQA